jgi:glycosyltransferase involved in cell wall biosynthesis
MRGGKLYSYGGLGICVLQLVEGLRARGIEVDILTRAEDGVVEEIIPGVYRTPYINPTGSRNWKLTHAITLIPKLIQLIKNNKYDIIHMHNPPAAWGALPVAKHFKIKSLMTMHGPWSKVREKMLFFATMIENDTLNGADAVTFDSHSLLDMYTYKDKYFAIENAVDTGLFKPMSRSVCRSKLGIMGDKSIFLYSGRNVHGKDLDIIYGAAKKCTNVEFIITGKDCDGRDVFCPNIIFKKSIPNNEMPILYNACNGVILPTKAEGMSRALLEAMSCGITVMASDIPANRETVGSCGGFFNSGEDLVKLIKDSNGASLNCQGVGGRERVLNNFIISLRIERFIRLYNYILK